MFANKWDRYRIFENVFNSIEDLIDGNLCGEPFDKNNQLESFRVINANHDGTCGKNIFSYIKNQ